MMYPHIYKSQWSEMLSMIGGFNNDSEESLPKNGVRWDSRSANGRGFLHNQEQRRSGNHAHPLGFQLMSGRQWAAERKNLDIVNGSVRYFSRAIVAKFGVYTFEDFECHY